MSTTTRPIINSGSTKRFNPEFFGQGMAEVLNGNIHNYTANNNGQSLLDKLIKVFEIKSSRIPHWDYHLSGAEKGIQEIQSLRITQRNDSSKKAKFNMFAICFKANDIVISLMNSTQKPITIDETWFRPAFKMHGLGNLTSNQKGWYKINLSQLSGDNLNKNGLIDDYFMEIARSEASQNYLGEKGSNQGYVPADY